jgi:hypothetical protein
VVSLCGQGYCNAFGCDHSLGPRPSVGLGGNISKSIYSMQPGVAPTPRFEAEVRQPPAPPPRQRAAATRLTRLHSAKTARSRARASSSSVGSLIPARRWCAGRGLRQRLADAPGAGPDLLRRRRR